MELQVCNIFKKILVKITPITNEHNAMLLPKSQSNPLSWWDNSSSNHHTSRKQLQMKLLPQKPSNMQPSRSADR